jgi:hypothetical protein
MVPIGKAKARRKVLKAIPYFAAKRQSKDLIFFMVAMLENEGVVKSG